MNKNNEGKRCIICNKPYNYHYDLFGRSCLTNLYKQLNVSNSRLISNKEKYLCNVIAYRNFKFFLGKKKKYALTENYIALDYLIDKITMPLYYSSFYEMQQVFWKIVVIGGLLADMKLSVYLMNISLTNSGEYEKEDNILIIEDENITKILFDNNMLKKK